MLKDFVHVDLWRTHATCAVLHLMRGYHAEIHIMLVAQET